MLARGVRPGFYLRHPLTIAHRVWRAMYQRRHPDHPWLAPAAIRFLERALTPGMVGLEWGSGRSTAWFAARTAHLTSVEHDRDWFDRVARLVGEAANVDRRLVPVMDDPERAAAEAWTDSPYVRVVDGFADGSLDYVLVDGLFRQPCVARVLPKVKPGGLLIIDQSRHLPSLADWGVPAEWELLVHPTRRLHDTTIWRRPS